MRCTNHPDVHTDEYCDFCARPFCAECIAEPGGQRYCPSCLKQAVEGESLCTVICPQAKNSLTLAICGLICAGPIFGGFAIWQGLKARELIRADEMMTGDGHAIAGIAIGAIDIVVGLAMGILFATWRVN